MTARNLNTNSMPISLDLPDAWADLVHLLSENTKTLHDEAKTARKLRERLRRKTEAYRLRIEGKSEEIKFPAETPTALSSAIKEAAKKIREHRDTIITDLDKMSEDFVEAEINQDRFIVLVFGAVNAGKSALANHAAGLDFDFVPDSLKPSCFLGDSTVPRLKEWPVECTRDYQGFKLPGLLWIDCPGVLSNTLYNSQLAHRLIGRADFVLFVSHSDAPFTESELHELSRLIRRSGNKHIDGCLVITKADAIEEDEVDGSIIKTLKRKSKTALDDQESWCREQRVKLKKSGLSGIIKMSEPICTSVYLARQALGRNWETGRPHRTPKISWKEEYFESGMPQLFEYISSTVARDGAKIKCRWPKKREAAFQYCLDDAVSNALEEVKSLHDSVKSERKFFLSKTKQTQLLAASLACEKVTKCLNQHNIHNFEKFNSGEASTDIQKILTESIERSIKKVAVPIIESSFNRVSAAIDQYISQTKIRPDLKQKFTTRSYKTSTTSTATGKAIGRGAGGIGGAAGGTKIALALGIAGGPLVLLAAVVGGAIAGGIVGWIGGAIGRKVGRKTVTERIATGTNADEVIAITIRRTRYSAYKGTASVFENVDKACYEPIIKSIHKVRRDIQLWKDSI